MGYGWGMGPAGWVFMGLFWIVLIGLVVWAVVAWSAGSRTGGRGGAEAPEEILDRRFAAGDLDADAYRRARQALAAAHSGRR